MEPYVSPLFEPQRVHYANLLLSPLRISIVLEQPIYAPDAPMLDGILSAAVVREVVGGSLIPDVPHHSSPVVPLPLQVMWRDQRGFPLWACTALVPQGLSATDVIYFHKRHQSGTWTQRTKTGLPFSVKPTDGRWMDRQRPVTALLTEALTCTAFGHAGEIERLLSQITHIGKDRGRGLGRVCRYEIEEVDSFSLAPDGVLQRSLPHAATAALGLALPGQALTLGAWTPPYWQNALYTLVHPIGAATA